MRSKITLVLFLLNLAVFGYLFLSDRPWSSASRLEEDRRRVLGPEAANLAALEITLATSPDATSAGPLRLERRGDTWFIAAPVEWPANEFAVRRILNELQFLEHETSFLVSDLPRLGQTLADFGLDTPAVTLVATPAPAAPDQPAADPFTLRIGGAGAGNRLYVLSPDERRVHVVPQGLGAALSLDLALLRSDRLFTIPVFEARALTLQTGAANTARTRLRRDQSRWLFESPIVARAAKTPVELAVNDLNALRVSRFLPADQLPPAENAESGPAPLRITLEGNGRRETLLLGAPVTPGARPSPDGTVERHARLEWRIAASPTDRAVHFTVRAPAALIETLEKAQIALRDPRVLDLDPDRVASLTLSAPGLPELRIQKLDADAAWRLLAPDQAEASRADTDAVRRLLARLQLLEAVRFASEAPSRLELETLGFNQPERVIVLDLAAPATTNAPSATPLSTTLELARPGGADPRLYARVVGQPFIYEVSPDALEQLPVAARFYRDRALGALPATTRITRLVLRPAASPDAPAVLDLDPARSDLAPAAITLLAALRDLRAESIVREDLPATVPVDGVERPWAWRLEATLDPALADGPLVYLLAERTGGGAQLIGSPARKLVFNAEQTVIDALWTLLRDAQTAHSP